MSSNTKEFQGKDIAEAIQNACNSLNASQEDLNIEVISTGSSGIFGLCRQNARLRVTLKGENISQEQQPVSEKKARTKKTAKSPKKASRKKKPRKEVTAEPKETLAENNNSEAPHSEHKEYGPEFVSAIQEELLKVLQLMGFPSEVSILQDGNSITGLIQGDNIEGIVGHDGKVLDSLQYLLRKMLSKKLSEKIMLSLDAGNFRASRMKDLEKLGLKLAEEVKENGKTKSIPSLNPSERRIVHMALQEDKDIRSRSVGEGLFKKILIYRPGKGKRNSQAKRRKNKQGQSAG